MATTTKKLSLDQWDINHLSEVLSALNDVGVFTGKVQSGDVVATIAFHKDSGQHVITAIEPA